MKYLEDWVTLNDISTYENFQMIIIILKNFSMENSAFPYNIKELMKHNECFDMIKKHHMEIQ